MVTTTIKYGDRFGLWSAQEPRVPGVFKIACRCDCGKTAPVNVHSLTSGRSKSCGCAKGRGPSVFLSAGEKFGRWTLLEDHVSTAGKVSCRCDCGTIDDVNVSNLRTGLSKSCGCLQRESTSRRFATHGAGYSDYRYSLWQTIKGKCLRESHKDWQYYGGRGICIHKPWIDDYPAFATHIDDALGPRPDGCSLDRIDNEGHYEPGNLRWATASEQAMNRRSRQRM